MSAARPTGSRRRFLSGLGAAAAAAWLPIPSWADPKSATAWRLPEKRPVKVIENVWIPLKDGTRLGARLWIPHGAESHPVPVVWEYLPYRKRDGVRARDDATAANLAPYGIAFARVDVRGTGDSDGVMRDEYSPAELDDGLECVAWLASQSWSNGAVGMRGISWGGINSLQIAALAPPALKAILSMGSVDNRFTGDAHYIGGALATENFKWGTYFKVNMAGPPDPEISGPEWEKKWRERLQATPSILEVWTSHQRYDAYWQRGSVAIDYGRIKCPVYAVGGWIDPYSDVVGTLLAGLKVPRKGLIGPWGHLMPNLPKPLALDWAYEEVRWWHQWLAGVDTGIMEEPMLRAYMPYRTLSEVYPREIPGRWVAEQSWPPAGAAPAALHLRRGQLATAPGPHHIATHVGDRIVGSCKPQWMPGLTPDQSADDLKSLVFDTEPLDTDREILGYPVARLRVGADVPIAKVAVRLTEVLPDGKSWLVSYGLLNLTHRDSHANPATLVPGRFYDVEVPLYMAAHRFKRGSRIRAAISESLWPLVWPSPQIATLKLDLGSSHLVLPVRPIPANEAPFPIPELRSAEASPYLAEGMTSPADGHWERPVRSSLLEDIGTTVTDQSSETVRITEGDPNSGVWQQQNLTGWKRGEWDCTVSAEFELRSTATEFRLKEVLRARKGETEIFKREKISAIKRDLL